MNAALIAFADAWSAWMATVALHVALLVLAALVLERLLGRMWTPALATAVWGWAALKLLLPPWLGSPIALWSLLPPPPASFPAAAESATGGTWSPTLMLALWTCGVAAALLLECRRRLRLARELRLDARLQVPDHIAGLARRIARELGLRRVPRLQISARVPGPAVVGAFRPMVLLPLGALLDPRQPALLEQALYHELAHVRRRDLLRGEFLRALSILYWFHPGVWIVRRRLEQLAELGCDAHVANVLGARARGYRQALLEFAARQAGLVAALPGGAHGWLGRPPLILERLRALERQPSSHPRLAAAAAFLVLAPVLLPAAAAELADTELEGERARALDVLQRAADGERQSCFALRHAAFTLSAQPPPQG